jgi:membrane protease YdiL (CAAX protease family)
MPAMKLENPGRALAALAVYALLYIGSLAWLSRSSGFETGEALGGLIVFGLGFSLAAWAATIGITPRHTPVRDSRRETGLIIGDLALFALIVLGPGLSWVKAQAPDGRIEEVVVLLFKLVTMVALPVWLFGRIGVPWRETLRIDPLTRAEWRVFLIMAVLLLGLQLVAGQGPKTIRALDASPGLIALAVLPAFAWMSLEAGLTEEVLFRVLLQTRLSAWLRSGIAGIVAMALLFGLAHAPGLVLRGAHLMEGMTSAPDALSAAAYTIAVVSPIGLMFGVLWARTRSLTLVVLLHGWTDLVPNLAPFVKTWLL